MMTRTHFHQELQNLRDKMMAMGGTAERALDLSIRAYWQRDIQLCKMVHKGESIINASERKIDELVLDLLAMQQPMAVDLRLLLAISKCIGDLERIGDQAVNIAQRVEDLITQPQVNLPIDLPQMAALARTMLRRALDAFATGDAAEAEAVLRLDDELDAMNRDAFVAVESSVKDNPQWARSALDILIISRNLERIGDHATNIAEDVIFWVRGADVRHHAAL
jgi:phosphate transport system protein